ncbi:MAG: ParB/RepB/Spo0J family partition protein [Oscillospiraceae bacterium]|jgi:ParB family chromosome partitioning protein|nr:ParB/RepB/Spo0J family partition protein [Oscillospiraceae bacterium]
MAPKKGGLGRGLDSLFEDNGGLEEQTAGAGSAKLRIMDVEPNRDQPRQDFDEAALAELSQSIAENGVLQPILVRPMPSGVYQIIAGERRWRAARMAGLSEIPAVIRELTDEQAMAAALIENLQRENLNPMEEALGYRLLMDTFRLTQDDVAKRLGKSRSAVANALRLLRLPKEVQDELRKGVLTGGHARALLGLQEADDVAEAARLMAEGALNVRDAEHIVKKMNNDRLHPKGEKKTAPPPFQPSRRDSFFDEVQLSLEQTLGRRVKVSNQGAGGTLTIDFFDQEDLKYLALQLGGAGDAA